MKREELLEKGYSEEQVTELLNMFHGVNDENKKLQNEINNKKELETKNAELQKKLDDINKANMSEQERLQKEKEEIERNLANSKKIYNTAKVKEILAGYEIEDELIDRLVSSDENDSINNANLFKSRIDMIKANTEKDYANKISNLDVKPSQTNIPQDNGKMTSEKLSKMTLTEQMLWKKEHEEEYDQIISE